MTREEARAVAELILQLKHPGSTNELIAGKNGVFHLLIHPANDAGLSDESKFHHISNGSREFARKGLLPAISRSRNLSKAD
jgi:hypothetical protein